ncbi:MAG: DGQHR domain-containing protein [Deltaproteobacteria bacterium]|nr:DGQHR domain-containing protein [Deltaproteobacteria bacterium]
MARKPLYLTLPALEVKQSRGHKLYTFAVDGKQVYEFADISRIKRVQPFELEGYQRPEVIAHIQEIREYIESDAPLIPNSIVIAFDSRVKFKPSSSRKLKTDSRPGKLQIPLGEHGPRGKVGFIVDGQQRLAAVRSARVTRFPLLVSAFITDDLREQTEQFILVNATKPLPKGLIYELLPHTDARLPPALHRRRLAAALLERLNHDRNSPMYKLIRSPTAPDGVIQDNSILKMLGNSLSDGLLYDIQRSGSSPEQKNTNMVEVLSEFWSAVKLTFGDAWGLPPRQSRLMHGAGIVALGNLMDHIGPRYPKYPKLPTQKFFRSHLEFVEPKCAWRSGKWKFGRDDHRGWNQIQNTRQDVELLTDYLQRAYDAARR